LKIVCISDVHEKWDKLVIPECDLLISSGDYSFRGMPEVVKAFHTWLDKQPAKNIISVQGNHELWVQHNFQEAKQIALAACPRVHFVEHELVTIDGIKIFCSAWTPWFHNWAYNAARTLEDAKRMQIPYIKDKWKDIPQDTEILVTHGGPHGILDMTYQVDGVTPRGRVGCESLMDRIAQIPTLKHHIFGHIHSSYGEKEFRGIKFYNAANCGETYTIDNPVTVFEYEKDT
jgi:Icc-related predicted phosphoesterase